MRYEEVDQLMDSIGIPCAYRSFPKSTDKSTPYLDYYYEGYDDFFADNKNYQKIAELRIELYTDAKDEDSEAQVEEVLDQAEITYAKEEIYIEDEELFEIIYESEVIINGQ